MTIAMSALRRRAVPRLFIVYVALLAWLYFFLGMAVEWRVHATLAGGATVIISLATLIALFALLHAAYPEPEVGYSGVVIAGVLTLFAVPSLGLWPAALIGAILGLAAWPLQKAGRWMARRRPLPQTRAVRWLTVLIHLVYFVPVLNLMHDHSLFGHYAVGVGPDGTPLFLNPSAEYDVNEHGYRGPVVDFADRSGTRILFLGDSSTFGHGVLEKDTFPHLVQEQFRSRGPGNVTVINGGVSGIHIADARLRYRQFRAWEPNLVFVMGGYHFRSLHSRRADEPEVLPRPVRGLMPIVMLFFGGITDRSDEDSPTPEQDRNLRLEWEMQFAALLDDIRADGAEPIVLGYPSDRIDSGIQQATIRIARDKDVRFVDLKAELGDDLASNLQFDGLHPNPRGHRRIAEIIGELLAHPQ